MGFWGRSPFEIGTGAIMDFWGILTQPPKQATLTASKYYGALGMPFPKKTIDVIKAWKAPELTSREYSLLGQQGIQLPDLGKMFGDVKNIAIIGAVAIGGLYLVGKFIGGKK